MGRDCTICQGLSIGGPAPAHRPMARFVGSKGGNEFEMRLGMSRNDTDLATKDLTRVERPRLYKVILINDDFTPREFVVFILKAEFRMNEEQARQVMLTAHRRGACVVAVFTQDVAETKATRATDAARKKGYPLLFTTEPEA